MELPPLPPLPPPRPPRPPPPPRDMTVLSNGFDVQELKRKKFGERTWIRLELRKGEMVSKQCSCNPFPCLLPSTTLLQVHSQTLRNFIVRHGQVSRRREQSASDVLSDRTLKKNICRSSLPSPEAAVVPLAVDLLAHKSLVTQSLVLLAVLALLPPPPPLLSKRLLRSPHPPTKSSFQTFLKT